MDAGHATGSRRRWGLYALAARAGCLWWIQLRLALGGAGRGRWQRAQTRYWRWARTGVAGLPAFVAMLLVYGLMVMKPPLWGWADCAGRRPRPHRHPEHGMSTS